MKLKIQLVIAVMLCFLSFESSAQQDPQYTQYMYNTMNVNPAYTGSRGHLTLTGYHRSQWVGLDGAPTTQALTIESPVGRNVGLGLSFVNDRLGPSDEFYFDGNFSYTLNLNNGRKLSFGVKGGGRMLNVDFTRGTFQSQEDVFQNNIRNRFLPTVGAGIYLHGDKSYIGFSVPNFLTNEIYDEVANSVAAERLHFHLIGGKVFDLSNTTKFMPAVLGKFVVGAPVIVDLSANFMFDDALRLGLAYRWDDSISGLIGLQISPKLLISYSYDYTTTPLQDFNSGTHDIMLRFELRSKERKLKSPRFF
ncbi:type IX secretion system membrane protein PorP/SprF [Winogradskyella sp. PE311]|uniref:PorP/SprF family type IX secretion system membrane protein n=1 Tax=Winogradskyella sp. PE311 TaxID=3366943 RepID=UPI0039802220